MCFIAGRLTPFLYLRDLGYIVDCTAFGYRMKCSIYVSLRFYNWSKGATTGGSEVRTPPPLFRPEISGTSRPRFRLLSIWTPNFWSVVVPLNWSVFATGTQMLVKTWLTLSLPVTHVCVNFSTVYNDMLVAKGLIFLCFSVLNTLQPHYNTFLYSAHLLITPNPYRHDSHYLYFLCTSPSL